MYKVQVRCRVYLVPEKWIPSYSEYSDALGQCEKNCPSSAKNAARNVRAARWFVSLEIKIHLPFDSEYCVSSIA